ncbi:MAG: Minf_1886 family protein [Candidatus Omnitrophota bacterium]
MINLYKKIEEIVDKDSRYKPDAYEFLMRALWFTQRKLKKQGHISGRELLEGIREFILDKYGPMSKAVLKHWGIETTDDFGMMVFNMVENGILKKTEQDSHDDFKNVYNFDEAFDIFKNKTFAKTNINSKRNAVTQKSKISTLQSDNPKGNPGGKNLN